MVRSPAAAPTAVVLTTRGKDVRIGRGTTPAVRLTAPLTVSASEQQLTDCGDSGVHNEGTEITFRRLKLRSSSYAP
jgi:hypothetical protein